MIDVDDEIAHLEIAKVREKRLGQVLALVGRPALFFEDVRLHIICSAASGAGTRATTIRRPRAPPPRGRVLGALHRHRDDVVLAEDFDGALGPAWLSATKSTVSPRSRASRISATQSLTRPRNSIAGWQRVSRTGPLADRQLLEPRRADGRARSRSAQATNASPGGSARRGRARPRRRSSSRAARAPCARAPRPVRAPRRSSARRAPRQEIDDRHCGPVFVEPLAHRHDEHLIHRRRSIAALPGRTAAAISTMSPTNSRRTGSRSPAGKMSTMPPRMVNAPCSSTGSSRVKPASTSRSARSCGSISVPDLIATDARSRRSGGLTRGSSAAAEATMSRAVPVATGWSARARAAATRKCGDMPRYGSTWSDGHGRTAGSTAASDAPSSAA